MDLPTISSHLPQGLCSVLPTQLQAPAPNPLQAHTLLHRHTCCRSTGVSVGAMPAGLLASMLFLVSARGCSMLRLGRDAYRWLPCRLTVGATARSMGLRLRSRGSFRQSPLAVLFLGKRDRSDGNAWHLGNGHVPSSSHRLFHLFPHLAVDVDKHRSILSTPVS